MRRQLIVHDEGSFTVGGLIVLLFVLLLLAPMALGCGLWLLGIPLDWGSWKTYAALVLICLAVRL